MERLMSGRCRCPWLDLRKPDYVAYHDLEWGVPAHDDRFLFELLILESAQAGLSWYSVLRRREGYRKAFDLFDPVKMASYDDQKLAQLFQDENIIRNRRKIASAINNARLFLCIQKEFGSFDNFLWRFVNGQPIVNTIRSIHDYPTTSPASEALSKELVSRGFSFVGPTICYAYMQAAGLVNDHSVDCYRREEIRSSY